MSPPADEPFLGSSAIRTGLLTRGQLRTRRWRRVRPDVYVAAELPLDHRLLARAVALVAPPSAVFAGLTATVLSGGRDLAGAADPVEVLLPTGVRWHPGPGVHVRTAAPVPPSELLTDGRLLWTGQTRTALDLARRGTLEDAVVLLDRLAQVAQVDLPTLRDAAAALPRCRGSRQAREAAALADGLAESPQETRLRLLLHRGGLPAPVAQFVVRDGGRFVARVDFAYPELRLAIEYDGLWHAQRLSADRQRMNRLAACGWRVLFVTARDLHEPASLVGQVTAARAERVVTTR